MPEPKDDELNAGAAEDASSQGRARAVDGLLREVARGGWGKDSAFIRRVMDQVTGAGGAFAAPRARWRFRLVAAAAAAALLVTGIGLFRNPKEQAGIARLEASSAGVRILRDGKVLKAEPQQAILAGDAIDVPAGGMAVAACPDATCIEIMDLSLVRWSVDAQTVELNIESGALRVRGGPSADAARRLRVNGRQASVVVGANQIVRYRVEPDTDQIEAEAGSVVAERTADQRRVTLAAGQALDVSSTGPLLAHLAKREEDAVIYRDDPTQKETPWQIQTFAKPAGDAVLLGRGQRAFRKTTAQTRFLDARNAGNEFISAHFNRKLDLPAFVVEYDLAVTDDYASQETPGGLYFFVMARKPEQTQPARQRVLYTDDKLVSDVIRNRTWVHVRIEVSRFRDQYNEAVTDARIYLNGEPYQWVYLYLHTETFSPVTVRRLRAEWCNFLIHRRFRDRAQAFVGEEF